MDAHEQARERIMGTVLGDPHQRIRPIDLEQKLEHEHGLARPAIKAILKELVDEGELVFTYRDPCSYVEIPVEESRLTHVS
jgi:hypothetical protein